MKSKVLQRWIDKNKDQGPYAGLVGFEKDLSQYEILDDVYQRLDIDQTAMLFTFVVDLLEQEAE